MLGGLLIKLGNNEWTNTPAASALVHAPRVSFVPFLSLPIFSLSGHLPSILPPHTVWWGAKDVCASQGAPRWGRVPDKVTATKRWFLFLSLFSSIRIPSFSSLSLPILYNCPIFLFFFSSTSPRVLPSPSPSPLLSLSLSIFPAVGSHLGECVASSNAPSRITINYLLRYLSPSTSSCPVLQFCNLHSLRPMRRGVTLREKMKDFHCERRAESSLFRSFLHSTIFLRPLFFSAVLSVPPHLAMSQSEARVHLVCF